MEVVVLEKTEDVSYSACGMPYNIADPGRDIEDLVVRKAEIFRKKQGINLLTGHRVDNIDPNARTVSGATRQGESFSFSYDRLIIATGASPVLPDIAGIDLPGVMGLKSLNDGRNIKSYIARNRIKKTVIMGMGYIGLEMCEALRALDIDVEMVKPGPTFLPWMDRELSRVVREEVESKGVRLYPGKGVKKIKTEGNHLSVVCDGNVLSTDMVLVAMGIRPNSKEAVMAGIKPGPADSIAVNKTLQTSAPDIFSAGDCADAYHVVTGEKTWIPLALRANRSGWAAADNVCGGETILDGVAGTAVFKVFGLQVARTGLTLEEAKQHSFEPASVTVETRSRAHSHPGASSIFAHLVGDKRSGKLLGAQLVGKEGVAHRINAAAVALHAGMTVRTFSGTDLSYAPPFGPTWDPLLTAANQLLKKMK
jgi:NADPH-dependent 2,4-dienoyl-CoA reductase/sulfur reductase-like enzyme